MPASEFLVPELLTPVLLTSEAETTVRVDTARLDEIMNMVGELVLIRNRLSNLQGKIADAEVTQAVSNLDVVTSDLQMAAMKTRMQPIKKVFGRFPRVVRDLARQLGKEIELEMAGEETDLDKNLAAPLLEKGARWADTAKEVAAASDVVFTCLPSPRVIDAVVCGPEGILAGLG